MLGFCRESWPPLAGAMGAGDRRADKRLRPTKKHVWRAQERRGAALQSAKSGRRSGGRTGSGICSAAAALALGLLDGFLRGLSDLCFAPQVLCASGILPFCLIKAPSLRKIRSHVVIYSYETGREL